MHNGYTTPTASSCDSPPDSIYTVYTMASETSLVPLTRVDYGAPPPITSYPSTCANQPCLPSVEASDSEVLAEHVRSS